MIVSDVLNFGQLGSWDGQTTSSRIKNYENFAFNFFLGGGSKDRFEVSSTLLSIIFKRLIIQIF